LRRYEANFPTKSSEAIQEAWLPESNGYPRGSRSSAPTTHARQENAERVNTRASAPGRLSRAAEFSRVYRKGRSAGDRMLVVYVFDQPDTVAFDGTRVGITVPKAVGSAVVRNKVKRQIREAVAQIDLGDKATSDIVVIARAGLAERIEAEGFDWLKDKIGELLGSTSTAS
jgi:ribonuclease P protein component